MSVTRQEVLGIAELARLSLSEEEVEAMTGVLNNILEYFDKLSELDTENVEPLTHILPVENVTREDKIAPSFDQETALANAPKHARGHFIIPKVIE